MNDIIAKTRKSDGRTVRVHSDGREEVLTPPPIRTMTEASIEAAAIDDRDARPMTPEQIMAAPRVPKVRIVRRALSLSQEEFATRFHIPLTTLTDWEQGRTEPDQLSRAYLKVIASDHEAVLRALEAS